MLYDVLLIGLGQIGMGYDYNHAVNEGVYTHARAFNQHPNFQLVGGVDSDISRGEMFESMYLCKSYSDLNEALSNCQPHLVIIAVPTDLHFEILTAVLENITPLAIMCEKPLAYELDTAKNIRKICVDKNVALYVNYIRRSDPGVIEIKKRLDSGHISSPIKGICWYSKGLIHNGSHFFNLLEYWLGSMNDAKVIEVGRLWDGADPEPDIQLKFEKGTVMMIALDEENFSHSCIELLASNGRLRYDKGGAEIKWQSIEADSNFSGYKRLSNEPEKIMSGMERYQWNVAEQLASALNGDKYELCNDLEALTTLSNMQSIIEMR